MLTTDEYGTPDCTVLRERRERLGYIGAHADAERRLKAGQRQTLCPQCERWAWSDERLRCDGTITTTTDTEPR